MIRLEQPRGGDSSTVVSVLGDTLTLATNRSQWPCVLKIKMNHNSLSGDEFTRKVTEENLFGKKEVWLSFNWNNRFRLQVASFFNLIRTSRDGYRPLQKILDRLSQQTNIYQIKQVLIKCRGWDGAQPCGNQCQRAVFKTRCTFVSCVKGWTNRLRRP